MGSLQDGRLSDVSSDAGDCPSKQKASVSWDFPPGYGNNENMGDNKNSVAVGVSESGNTSELVNISVLQQLVKNLVKSELTGSLLDWVEMVKATCEANGIDSSLLLKPEILETMPPKSSDELPGIENQATLISDIGSTSDGKMLDAKQCGPPEGSISKSAKGIVGRDSTSERSTLGIQFPSRRVSVVREYPPFCGRNAPRLTERIRSRNMGKSHEKTRVSGRHEILRKRKFEDMDRPLKKTSTSLGLSANKGRGQELKNVEARDGPSKERKLEELGRKQTAADSRNSSLGVRATETNFGSKTTPSIKGVKNTRDQVLETLALFRSICEELEARKVGTHENVIRRVDLEAAKIIRKSGKKVNTHRQWIGSVPGVEVGDEFLYRVELVSVGIHRQYRAGIDYITEGSKIIATSVIASEGGYSDDRANPEVLIYSGQGGNIIGRNDEPPKDQKLEKGNLALKNSITARNPVRVTRGYKTTDTSRRNKMVTYTYDGLYMVEKYWRDVGQHGKIVYMFELRRIPGQPKVAWKTTVMNGY